MAKQKDVEWLELCAYVEKEIFKYDSSQKLQKKACLILQGLKKGQCVANNNNDAFGEYTYKIILLTFKANKVKILSAIKGKSFKSESSKMAYVTAIIRDSINDIYMRYTKSLKTEEKIEVIDTAPITHEGAEYKKDNNTSLKLKEKFKELW